MAFDGFTNYIISKELEPFIVGSKVDSIFEPNNNEIILCVYNNGIKLALDIVVSSNNYRICVTNSKKNNPTFAPNFCMVLRKHLLNSRITNIYTLALERIIVIEFEGHNKSGNFNKKRLIIELMGKHSNIILVDSSDTIIDALRHFTIENNSYRNIIANVKYQLPVSTKLDFTQLHNFDDFYHKTLDYIKNNEYPKLSDILSCTYTGISKTLILNILTKKKVDDHLSKENLSLIYDYLKNLLNNVSQVIATYYTNDYSVCISDRKIDPLQVNLFVDDFYTIKENEENFKNIQNNFSNEILSYFKKLNTKLTNINSKLKECEKADLYKLYGELITNNLYRIANRHIDSLIIENYYDNNNLITIPLDKSIFPSANAKKYFKKYTKLKNAKKIVEIQKKEVEEEINYLESIIYEFEVASNVEDIENIRNEFHENFVRNTDHYNKNKKLVKSKKKSNSLQVSRIGTPLKFIIDNYTVIVGKSNKQNDFITKQANTTDIWFHAKDIHGSHVILKTNNKVPLQDTINKVAAIAAFYSKASTSSNVPVDYTFIQNVKKPSKSKPGMVTYTNYKTVIVKPSKP